MSRNIFIIIVFLAIAGAGVLYVYSNSLPDADAVNQEVREQLLMLKQIDASVNESLLRSSQNLDSNYDSLARNVTDLQRTTEKIETSFGDSDGLVTRAIEQWKNEIVIKTDLIENFKSHHAVLRNSERYAPAAAKQLQEIAKQEQQTELALLYQNVSRELLEFSLLDSSSSLERMRVMIPQLDELEKEMPDYANVAMIEFKNHVNTVIKEKSETDAYLRKALSATTNQSLSSLTDALQQMLNRLSSNKLNSYAIGYLSFLILAVIYSAFRLWSLYSSMDREIEQRTKQVEKAYNKLRESEHKLVQSEKMTSLGNLVGGISHEMNTPLGFVKANLTTIQRSMDALANCLAKTKKIDLLVSNPAKDSKAITDALKELVMSYRKLDKVGNIGMAKSLLGDSIQGLQEVSRLVVSLKDFGRLENKEKTSVDINEALNTTFEACELIFEKRTVNVNLSPEVEKIDGIPTQLSQMFANILTNAAQACGEQDGVIDISSMMEDDHVVVTIEDNGAGMDEKTINKVYDPFFTTKDVGEGLGLGMSIAHSIAENHDAAISIASKIGRGTTVTVKFPLQS